MADSIDKGGDLTWKEFTDQMNTFRNSIDVKISETQDKINKMALNVAVLAATIKQPCPLHGNVIATLTKLETGQAAMVELPEKIAKAQERTKTSTFSILMAIAVFCAMMISLAAFIKDKA